MVATYRSTSPVGLLVRLAEDADKLVRLQTEMAMGEARQVAERNRGPMTVLIGGIVLLALGLLVALPALLMTLLPWHWQVAAVWLALYVIAGAIAIPIGRSRLRVGMPHTVAMIKESEEWMLAQLRSLDV
jgi:uncharacterized integral membrane protein